MSPEAPHINEIEAGANEIKGTSEPNSTVVITLPGGTIVEVETDNNGNWKLETNDKLSNGSTIEAAAKDLAGNVSEKVSIIVKDTIPPAPPTVNPLKSTDTELSGTAEPNSKITIKLNDRIVTVETNAAGQWKYIYWMNTHN
ncbi:Ig-like domain-containing protein [Staphylococcus carnosus]|uniref:Ig-like domain-containing protein n=1 Tax=Staphylococcus carnosus TaxID=1281 RepID=UPI0021000336|nr:Ig-like domain-containing protein [Staphylococcus carnosus]